ncbi:hypothetical protein LTR85_011241 [Meristemomyces frigidus]|nr:hypothetical protein LTR85_011241 [Meristemomyces frigidus]
MSADSRAQKAPFDVYARPFIPNSLKAVNEVPYTAVPSLPVRWIDFPAYVSSFAGTSLLLADPPPPDLSGDSSKVQSKPSHSDTTSLDTGEPEGLQASGYHAYFQAAMIDEAAALQHECEDYALYKVPLEKAYRDPRPNMYQLKVPGLRELSLRIEIGDIVQLRQLIFDARGAIMHVPYIMRHDAVVWSIDRLREMLTLNVQGLLPRSMMFNVSFSVQAGRLGALYRSVMGIQKALQGGENSWTRTMLFPDEADGTLQRTLNKFQVDMELHDSLLNYEQIRAVDTVLQNDFGRVPFLISGPPGTGKTKTLVELALQIISKQQGAHLLLCAPSDPAADTLVQRLSKHLQPSQMLRLTAPSRSFPEVPDSVLSFCYVDSDMFSLPPLQQMMRYNIVVTTCRDAELMLRARLSNADLYDLERGMMSMLHPKELTPHPGLHWTGLLMDEAAQATEPEALIPLSVIAPPPGYEATEQLPPVFIMAGDNHQLGPRTASRTVAMQTSLFERFLERPLYRLHLLARSKQSGGVMRPLTQSMLPIIRPAFANLIRNYRSHPAILATPSSLFYNDTLEPEATNTTSLLPWQGWKGRKWPVLFACNTGSDEMEQDGGGWYNNAEAKMACQYAISFLQAGLAKAQEICIMSPFRAQVRVLRQFARHPAYNIPAVNIGPLEAFQGLESMLVILCTTRTRDRFIEQDVARGLGVMHEPRRFNVALTRAKEGLIVIGNPAVLGKDKHWATFLAFCHRNGLREDEVGKACNWPASNAPVSKLEKQLLYRNTSDTTGDQAAADGVRTLGLGRNEDEDIWHSGMAAEAVVQDEDEVDDGDTASS